MASFRKVKIGKDRGYIYQLQKLLRNEDPLDDLKEHISVDEKRQAIRIYVEHKIEFILEFTDETRETLEGKSVNISESGILLACEIPVELAERIDAEQDSVNVYYSFIEPKELVGEKISGTLRRVILRKTDDEGMRNTELGVRNFSIVPEDLITMLQYINKLVMDGINEDIMMMENILKTRHLLTREKKVYEFLMKEKGDYTNYI